MNIYLIGSLRNNQIPVIAKQIREFGHTVFDDWYAAGAFADDAWQAYETDRKHTYAQALAGYAAQHVFAFDKHHLERADAVVLVTPAGKSGHLELGWSLGKGKPGYILLDAPVERYDVMYSFATAVVETVDGLIMHLEK